MLLIDDRPEFSEVCSLCSRCQGKAMCDAHPTGIPNALWLGSEGTRPDCFSTIKGGAGSGNWGHAGRIGQRGGSMPRGASSTSGADEPVLRLRPQMVEVSQNEREAPATREEDKPSSEPEQVKDEPAIRAERLLKVVDDESNAIRASDIEHAACIDSTGEVLFRRDGEKDQVAFTDDEADQMYGTTLIHNHPQGSAPSNQDAYMAIIQGVTEVRVCTKDYDYSLTGFDRMVATRFSGGRHAAATMLALAHRTTEAKVFGQLSEAIRLGKITVAEANLAHGHIIWTQVAEKYGLTYTRTPLKVKVAKGGEGSGNWGHAGRIGQVGGSMPRGVNSTGSATDGEHETAAIAEEASPFGDDAADLGIGLPKEPFVKGRDVTDEYTDSYDFKHWALNSEARDEACMEGNARGDMILGKICELQGFDGPPKVGTKEELDQLVSDGGLELFRGVDREEYVDQYREGDLYYGYGCYGNGTYAAYQSDVAVSINHPEYALDVAESYANTGALEGPSVMRMVLHPDARIINCKDAEAAMWEEATARGLDFNGATKTFCDIGRWAAMKGFDAIDIPVNGYMVILNRTAVTVQDTLASKLVIKKRDGEWRSEFERFVTPELRMRDVTVQPAKPTEAKRMSSIVSKGGAGSGNWGHAGRPGLVGGSMPRGVSSAEAASDSSAADSKPDSQPREGSKEREAALSEELPKQPKPKKAKGRDVTKEFCDSKEFAVWAQDDSKARTAALLGGTDGKGGDLMLAKICQAQGFDGAPAVGTTEELDQLVKDGGVELFRGVSDEAFIDQFREGDLYYGYGVFGNGTYGAYHTKGEPDDSALSEAEGYARMSSSPKAAVMRMVLRADARVVSIDDVRLATEAEPTPEGYGYGADIVLRDAGRWAAMKGYDAIAVPDRGYMVVLNRTAVTVQDIPASKFASRDKDGTTFERFVTPIPRTRGVKTTRIRKPAA